jgi:hypothetical protein
MSRSDGGFWLSLVQRRRGVRLAEGRLGRLHVNSRAASSSFLPARRVSHSKHVRSGGSGAGSESGSGSLGWAWAWVWMWTWTWCCVCVRSVSVFRCQAFAFAGGEWERDEGWRRARTTKRLLIPAQPAHTYHGQRWNAASGTYADACACPALLLGGLLRAHIAGGTGLGTIAQVSTNCGAVRGKLGSDSG